MAWHSGFERAFYPKTVAVVGASRAGSNTIQGSGFIRNFQRLGFEGRIYPVNPNLTLVPEPLDLVIVSTPATVVPAVLEECIAIGAKNVHVFTAGFSETGEEEGRQLEEKIKKIALDGELNLIGPNCMRINVPRAKMLTLHGMPLEVGPVAFLSQSGGHALQFAPYAQEFGIGFSKVISYGNGCIMDSTDFLEYLAIDPETKIITMYIEGVRDGRKLLRQVSEINRTKPVIVWKGGLSESGKRAAASHTGTLAGSTTVWNAFFKQTGAVQVGILDELADMTMTFLCLTPPQGRRVALLMGGGGRSVTAADLCAQEGLEVPVFTTETRGKLRNLIPAVGTSVKNPIDADLMQRDPSLFRQVLELVAEDPIIDIIIADLHLNMLQQIGPNVIHEVGDIMSRFVQQHPGHKPLVAILGTWGGGAGIGLERSWLQSEFSKVGIGVYRTLPRACRALAKLIGHHEFQERSKLE